MKAAQKQVRQTQSNSNSDWSSAPQFYLNGETLDEQLGIITLVPSVKASWDKIISKIQDVQSHLDVELSEDSGKYKLVNGNTTIAVFNILNDPEGVQALLKANYVRFNLKPNDLAIFD